MNSAQYKIYGHLVNEIVEGHLPVNCKLEPEIELGKRFSTTRMNAHRAIKQLERRGIVRRSRQEGTIVIRPITPSLARQLKGEAVRRICAIRSRNAYESLYWNDEFLKGLEPKLTSEGFSLESAFINDIDTREELKNRLKDLTDSGISAFVLSVRGLDDSLLLDNADILFQYHRNIFVYQSGVLDWMHWPFHTITVNLFGEGSLAAEYLIGSGHEHIAYCLPDNVPQSSEFWMQERFKGLQFGMRRMTDGRSTPDKWQGVEQIYNQFIANGRQHALVATNDEHVAELISYLAGRGLAAGRDFKIIGFDDSAKFRKFQITTIAPPHREIGHQLAEMIIARIDIEAKANTTCYLKIDSEIIVKETA